MEVIGHGDLAAPQFGTGEAVYKRLCEEVDVVVHCAAAVKFHLNYTMLKEDNVTATLRVHAIFFLSSFTIRNKKS